MEVPKTIGIILVGILIAIVCTYDLGFNKAAYQKVSEYTSEGFQLGCSGLLFIFIADCILASIIGAILAALIHVATNAQTDVAIPWIPAWIITLGIDAIYLVDYRNSKRQQRLEYEARRRKILEEQQQDAAQQAWLAANPPPPPTPVYFTHHEEPPFPKRFKNLHYNEIEVRNYYWKIGRTTEDWEEDCIAYRRQNRENRIAREREEREMLRKQEQLERDARAEAKRKEEQERTDPTPILQDHTYPAEIPYELRAQHVCVPGGTQRGKTNLLRQLVLKDIRNGHGVGVLDPKGTLVRFVCNELPEDRMNDVIYLDLQTPIPIDFMSYESEEEMEALVGELKYLVLKGDETLKRSEPILTDLLYSLLSCEGTTFLDIHHFFRNAKRQKEIMHQLKTKHPDLWQRWNDDMPKDTSPITNRMNDFIRVSSLKAIFDSAESKLNIARAMDQRKIILVNLAGIGNARKIFGSLLVTKFQQAAFRRAHLHKSQIIPFYLYADEFEYFQTQSFAEIFSVAGGLGLGLTIGHQYSGQLDADIRHALVGNAGNYIIFQLGDDDLQQYRNVIHPYDIRRLGKSEKDGLQPYQACFKIQGKPPIFKWVTPPPHQDEEQINSVIADLKEQTLREYKPTYAENSTNRIEAPSSGQSFENISSLEGDAHSHATTEKGRPPDYPPRQDL